MRALSVIAYYTHNDFGGEREKQFWITRDRVGLQNQTECFLEMRIKLLIVVSNLLACQQYSYSVEALAEREAFSRYCPIELAVAENTLFALPPINRSVPTTITKMTASITAYSAISCPSSCDQSWPRKLVMFAPRASQFCISNRISPHPRYVSQERDVNRDYIQSAQDLDHS